MLHTGTIGPLTLRAYTRVYVRTSVYIRSYAGIRCNQARWCVRAHSHTLCITRVYTADHTGRVRTNWTRLNLHVQLHTRWMRTTVWLTL